MQKRTKILTKLLTSTYVLVSVLTLPASPVFAGGVITPRPDRPGDLVYISNFSDPSSQQNINSVLTNAPQVVDLASNGSDFFLVTPTGDVWDIASNGLQQVSGIDSVKAMAGTPGGISQAAFAIKNNGDVWSWGHYDEGILGRDPGSGANSDQHTDNTPTKIPGVSNVVKIAGGTDHVLALKADGSVWGWGNNEFGQLGTDPSVTYDAPGSITPYPAQISLPSPAVSIAAGNGDSMALLANGDVYEWGALSAGKEGNLWPLNPTPIKIANFSNAIGISDSAFGAAYVLKADGTVWGWGLNSFNELALGSGVAYSIDPVQITGLPPMQEINSLGGDAEGRSQTDSLWAWGGGIDAPPVSIPNSQGAGAFFGGADQLFFVKPTGPVLSSVSVSPSPVSINRGAQQQLAVTGAYSDSTTSDVTAQTTFNSSNPAVASVDVNGKVTGAAVGTANITATYNGFSATTNVTVNPVPPQPPTGLTLANGSSAGKLNLTWQAPSDNGGATITNYLVLRRTGTTGSYAQIASVSGTTLAYNDTGLTTGTTYYYEVVAVNSAGQSAPSASVSKQAPGILGNPVCVLGICI